MRVAPASLTLAAALLASACLDPWRPVTFVEGLRVLALRAEPPDLAPGQAAVLSAVVVDPTDADRTNTLIWFACDPDPTNLDQPACAQYATLEVAQSGDFAQEALPEGVRILGMTPPPGVFFPIGYQAPADTFAKVPADDPKRTRGALAIVLMMSIAAPPPESWPPTEEELRALLDKVKNKEVASLVTIKRIRVTEDPARNVNPVLAGVRIGSETWRGEPSHPAKVKPGAAYPLVALAGEGSAETYATTDVDGNPVEKTETLLTSWFTTFGNFDEVRVVADKEDAQKIHLPWHFEAMPADRKATMWVVLRDGRGGVDAKEQELYLCDASRGAPVIESVVPTAGPPGTLVRLSGQGVEELLDVRLGEGFLVNGEWDAASRTYVGSVPANAPVGELKLQPRGRGCAQDPELAFTVTK